MIIEIKNGETRSSTPAAMLVEILLFQLYTAWYIAMTEVGIKILTSIAAIYFYDLYSNINF